jgi:hypothetical protein
MLRIVGCPTCYNDELYHPVLQVIHGIHGYLDRWDFCRFYRSIEDVNNPSKEIG